MSDPIHIAVTRRVKPGHEEAFEQAILQFIGNTLESSGSLGAQVIRPVPESGDRTYGILRTFRSAEDRDRFYGSDQFQSWIQTLDALCEPDGYSQRELHGLEAFFYRLGRGQPPRWKMALLTWAGVWPSAYLISRLLGPFLPEQLPGWLSMGVSTACVVLLLAWGIMPMLVRWFHPWLHRPEES